MNSTDLLRVESQIQTRADADFQDVSPRLGIQASHKRRVSGFFIARSIT
jgi:hypothetical protein